MSGTTTVLSVFSGPTRLALGLLYGGTTLVAVFGNLLVLVVLYWGEGFSRGMRLYLISLALSDLLMAVCCIPFTYTHFVYREWLFYEWTCYASNLAMITFVFTSVYTLIAVALDR